MINNKRNRIRINYDQNRRNNQVYQSHQHNIITSPETASAEMDGFSHIQQAEDKLRSSMAINELPHNESIKAKKVKQRI